MELAREAGISRGALYYQFADKKDLFRALVVRLLEEVAEDVTRETMSRIARDRDDLVDEGTVAPADLEPLSQLISGALIRAALAIGQAADPVAVAGRYRSGLLALYRGIIPDIA